MISDIVYFGHCCMWQPLGLDIVYFGLLADVNDCAIDISGWKRNCYFQLGDVIDPL